MVCAYFPFLYKLLYFLYSLLNFDLLDTPSKIPRSSLLALGSLLVFVVLLSRCSSEHLRTSGICLDAQTPKGQPLGRSHDQLSLCLSLPGPSVTHGGNSGRLHGEDRDLSESGSGGAHLCASTTQQGGGVAQGGMVGVLRRRDMTCDGDGLVHSCDSGVGVGGRQWGRVMYSPLDINHPGPTQDLAIPSG